jgi:hypothetical protein
MLKMGDCRSWYGNLPEDTKGGRKPRNIGMEKKRMMGPTGISRRG